ncbi:MAG TPA: hypothetical protein VKA15_25095, partial [Isosphaeraceae bacterium]|nr:hypothetical protein [Isosphaeraceae bacterium]
MRRLSARWYPERGRFREALHRRPLSPYADSLPEPGAGLRAPRGGGARRRPLFVPHAPMTDLARIESDLTGLYPEPWVQYHLASFRAPYFAAFDGEDIARHLGRSLALTDERPVAVETWPEGPGAWRVEAVGFDAFQLLSTLCTLLAIHGLSIVEGQAFTSDPRLAPAPPAPRRRGRVDRPPAPG